MFTKSVTTYYQIQQFFVVTLKNVTFIELLISPEHKTQNYD
jgi:hypothetical protein